MLLYSPQPGLVRIKNKRSASSDVVLTKHKIMNTRQASSLEVTLRRLNGRGVYVERQQLGNPSLETFVGKLTGFRREGRKGMTLVLSLSNVIFVTTQRREFEAETLEVQIDMNTTNTPEESVQSATFTTKANHFADSHTRCDVKVGDAAEEFQDQSATVHRSAAATVVQA